jgi:hypothetical protein
MCLQFLMREVVVLGFTPMEYLMGPSLLGEPMTSSFKKSSPNVTT